MLQPEPPTEADVRAAVNAVIDPCSIAARSPVGLDDMGLVGDITIEPGPDGAIVAVEVGVTHPFCMMAAIFMNQAHDRIAALPGVARVDVSLLREVVWTPDRMKSMPAEALVPAR